MKKESLKLKSFIKIMPSDLNWIINVIDTDEILCIRKIDYAYYCKLLDSKQIHTVSDYLEGFNHLNGIIIVKL